MKRPTTNPDHLNHMAPKLHYASDAVLSTLLDATQAGSPVISLWRDADVLIKALIDGLKPTESPDTPESNCRMHETL